MHSSNFILFILSYPYTPIEKLLHLHKLYPQFKKQLCIKQIIYLEQLTLCDNSVLLDWQHISPRIQQILKGHKPLWFLTLENKLLVFQQKRKINLQLLQLSNINTLFFTTEHYKIKPKLWLIIYN